MATLTWGKPKLEIWAVVQGSTPTPADWLLFPDAKQDSAKLSTSKGTRLEAAIEGGELIDVKYQKNKFTFECEVFVQRGAAKPIADSDGITEGFYSLRLTPEDATLKGWQLDKTKVSVEESWTSKEGTLLKYTFEALEPTAGNVLKEYTETYERIAGLSLADGSVTPQQVTLFTEATPVTYIVLPDGSQLTTNVSGEINTTWIGAAGDIVIVIPKGNSISLSDGGNMPADFIGALSTETNSQIQTNGCPNITAIDAPLSGHVACSDCTSLTTLSAPKATYLYCNNCSSLTTLSAPNATSLYCSGCTSLPTLSAPKATYLFCSNCSSLTTLSAPKATYLYCYDCTSLTTLSAPNATSLECYGCTSLTTLSAPNATSLNCSDCTSLTTLSAPNATDLYCSGCTSLTTLSAPKATIIDALGCSLTVVAIASLLAELVATGNEDGMVNISLGNNASYALWTQQAKDDKDTLVVRAWLIINKA